MSKGPAGQWGGWSTLLMLVAVVSFVWGLERWRRDAAHRAGSSESARLAALSRCMLGADGPSLMHTPSAARQRLRALAMATGTRPDVTWIDRCVPLAERLSQHGVEVDNTGAITAAQTRFAQSARALAQAVGRVGLVWTVRAGDTEMDMDVISERLLNAATELDLAGAPPVRAGAAGNLRDDGPVAPAAPVLVDGTRIEAVGLEPLPYGTPARFFVGAPMPVLGEVYREADGWHRRPVAGDASVLFRASASGITRADAFADPVTPGLARARWLRPGADPYVAHVTLIDNPEDARHVSMDAIVAGPALWFAEWTPWRGGVLAPFVGEMARTSIPLPQLGAVPAANAPTTAPTIDEHIAVAQFESGAVVAYTSRERAESPHVMVSSARWDRGRVVLTSLGDFAVSGHAPALEFCKLGSDAVALFIAGTRGWQVVRVSSAGIARMASSEPNEGEAFDERLTLRCERDGAVAYARERPRESPLFWCRASESGNVTCEDLRAPQVYAPSTIPPYATRGPSGRPVSHAEWPLAFARAGGTLLAVSAVGPVVSVLRREAGGAWDEGHVVFDASARTHGFSVAGAEIYAEGDRAVIAVGTQDGLHVFESDDGGQSWR